MTLAEFASAIATHLREQGIPTVLTGGAAVSIYTNNKYESGDADFISPEDQDRLRAAMAELGFEPVTEESRVMKSPHSEFTVEFPARQVILGSQHQPKVGELEIAGNKINKGPLRRN